MDEPTDLKLLGDLRSRAPGVRDAAFAELHRRHAPRSFRLAYRVLRDADLAADAVQEAFLTVYRKGARFEERAQFTSWLFRVVLNRSIDLRRREQRRGAQFRAVRGGGAQGDSEHGDALASAAAPGAGPEADARAAELAEAVRQAVDRLSPKLAEVVVLRYPEGLSYEEIGEVLGLPPGTVRSRLNRAHAALRQILGATLDEDSGIP